MPAKHRPESGKTDWLRSNKTKRQGKSAKLCSLFLDDYKFEAIWKDPEPRVEKLRQYKGILSPPFSTFYTMPTSIQIYNTFRSRWCGAYFQYKGFQVIPTVSWGLPQSYWYCFDGIEKGSVVAVSTLGVRNEKDFFMQGYNEMIRRIEPEAVICYCDPFPEMKGRIIPVDYAQTNRLNRHTKFWTANLEDNFYSRSLITEPGSRTDCYVKKENGYVIVNGFGRGGNQKPSNREKPMQIHHIATNKHQYYTPLFKKITDQYGLDLDGEWNKIRVPHEGRHPNAYHEYVLERMRLINTIAQGNTAEFLLLFEELRIEISLTHDILYQKSWEDIYEIL